MKLEYKYVCLGAYLAFCVILGLLIAKITPNECISKMCVKKAKLILKSMGAFSPCDNFYQFICGNYDGVFSDNNYNTSVWEELKEQQIRKLPQFLGNPPVTGENRILRVLKLVYQSCVHKEQIDAEGVQPLKNNMQAAGGFPLLLGKRWDDRNRNWSLGVAEFNIRYTGFKGGHIFESHVDHLQTKKEEAFVHLTPPELPDFHESHSDFYFTYVKKISGLINTTFEFNDTIEQELNKTIDFKIKITNLTSKVRNCSTPMIKHKLSDVSKSFPFLGLDQFIPDMLPFSQLPKHIVVTFDSESYFTSVKDLIGKTPNRVVANYLMIANIMEASPMLPTPFREAYEEYERSVLGPDYRGKPNREIECVENIRSRVGSAVSSLFLSQVFHTYKRPEFLLKIIISLKEKMVKMINKVNWMDNPTKEIAINKIKGLDYAVPVPKDMFMEMTNKTAIRVYYEELCFTGNTTDSLTAFLALQRFKTDKNWELLDRDKWVFDNDINIFTAEVSYDHRRNLVVIPMGFLRYPAFDELWPNYLNYGGLCSKVAMEMIRAIDLSGSQRDESGEMNDWWSHETKAEYRKQARCFVNRYNMFLRPLTKVRIKDPQCVLNNIANVAGLSVAYTAYAKYDAQRFFPERNLPGLKNYTPKQLFFIDYATFYCSKNRSSIHDDVSEADLSVAPNEYTVNSALRNSGYFSELFGCQANDTMNPTGKCQMWDTGEDQSKGT